MRSLTLAVALSLISASALADIQKSGPEQWPGKFQVTVHPISGQAGFTGNEPSGYRFNADFAGLVKDMDKISLWIGGGINYANGFFLGCVGCGSGLNQLGFWVFVEIGLEKLLNIPLVPYVRGGPAGGALFYGNTGGFFDIRIESGVHYFITKNIGLGAHMGVGFGAGFFPFVGGTSTGFYGEWDGGLGAKFAF
jgi:hypothetical protein